MQAIHETYIDVLDSVSDEVINLLVLYDGTWRKRGTTSRYEMGIVDLVMKWISGLVLCLIFMFCQSTVALVKRTRANYETKSCEYKKWKEIHN